MGVRQTAEPVALTNTSGALDATGNQIAKARGAECRIEHKRCADVDGQAPPREKY